MCVHSSRGERVCVGVFVCYLGPGTRKAVSLCVYVCVKTTRTKRVNLAFFSRSHRQSTHTRENPLHIRVGHEPLVRIPATPQFMNATILCASYARTFVRPAVYLIPEGPNCRAHCPLKRMYECVCSLSKRIQTTYNI